MKKIVIIYLLIINIIGFFAMKSDKARAKAKAWRISEKTLFGIAIFGGSIGIWAGMYQFRHKTKHWYFKFGIPFLVFLQIVLCVIFSNLY